MPLFSFFRRKPKPQQPAITVEVAPIRPAPPPPLLAIPVSSSSSSGPVNRSSSHSRQSEDLATQAALFESMLASFSGRRPSEEAKHLADRLREGANRCVEWQEWTLMERIFELLERFDQNSLPPTSGSPLDDLRVDLATLKGLVSEGVGGRSEIEELIAECENQVALLLSGPSELASRVLLLNAELEAVKAAWSRTSGGAAFGGSSGSGGVERPGCMDGLAQTSVEIKEADLGDNVISLVPNEGTDPFANLEISSSLAGDIGGFADWAVAAEGGPLGDATAGEIVQEVKDVDSICQVSRIADGPPVDNRPTLPLQSFRIDSMDAPTPPADNEPFLPVERLLVETRLRLASMSRDVCALALLLPRAEELSVGGVREGRLVLSEEIILDFLMSGSPFSDNWKEALNRKFLVLQSNGGGSCSLGLAAHAMLGHDEGSSSPWIYVRHCLLIFGKRILRAWLRKCKEINQQKKFRVLEKLKNHVEQRKKFLEQSFDFARMSEWRKVGILFILWRKEISRSTLKQIWVNLSHGLLKDSKYLKTEKLIFGRFFIKKWAEFSQRQSQKHREFFSLPTNDFVILPNRSVKTSESPRKFKIESFEERGHTVYTSVYEDVVKDEVPVKESIAEVPLKVEVVRLEKPDIDKKWEEEQIRWKSYKG